MSTFFVTSMAQIVMEIPRSEFDHMRALGAGEGRIVWEVVVAGHARSRPRRAPPERGDGVGDDHHGRGISRAEGGIGALILNQNKHFLLAEVYAILAVILVLGLLMDYLMGSSPDALPHSALGRVQR